MFLFISLLEIALYFFGSWTLAYHLILLTRLPAGLTLFPLLMISVVVMRWRWQAWHRSISHLRRPAERQRLLVLLLIGLVLGVFTLVMARPDEDDIGFFHRALVQSFAEPFILTDTLHNMSGLAPLSVLHVATSYEPLMTFLAAIPGVDPLSAYQNATGFLTALLMPLAYVLLYRELRLGWRASIVATLCAFAFLLIDGNLHRSFGNMGFVRLWQGKMILISLFLPLTLLLSLRFFRRPTFERWLAVFMAGVCGFGLSNMGIFQVSVLVVGISAALLLIYGWRYWRRALLLALAGSLYAVGPALLLLFDALPKPRFVVTGYSEESTWIENFATAVGGAAGWLRNALILLVVPLAGLRRTYGWLLVALTVVFVLMFLNPLTGPIWFSQIIRGGVYWRIIYVFPLPLCAGLIGAALLRGGGLRYAVAGVTLVGILLNYNNTVINPTPDMAPIELKPPWEYRMRDRQLSFVRLIDNQPIGDNLLVADDFVAVTLQLMHPTIRYEAGRRLYTAQVFQDSNLPEERRRRLVAQGFLQSCQGSPEGEAGLHVAIRNGLDGIILRDCGKDFTNFLIALGNTIEGRWVRAGYAYGYVWLRRVE